MASAGRLILFADVFQAIDKDESRGAILVEPVVGCIADDAAYPGSRIAIGKGTDSAQRPNTGFLNDIVRVGGIAREPAGQRIRIVDMRLDDAAEPSCIVLGADSW